VWELQLGSVEKICMRLGWRDVWLQVVVLERKNDKNSNKQSRHYGLTLHQRPKWMAARMAVHYVDTWKYFSVPHRFLQE